MAKIRRGRIAFISLLQLGPRGKGGVCVKQTGAGIMDQLENSKQTNKHTQKSFGGPPLNSYVSFQMCRLVVQP